MSFENETDTDSDYYEPDEEIFYRGYISPADEWNVKPDSLFTELQGTIFDATNAVTRRLKRLNEVIAYSESKNKKQFNKKTRISNQYTFMQQFIPENIYKKISEILGYSAKDKKKIAKDIGLNVDTLANILSLWELELYTNGNYVSELTLDEINSFLKESSTIGNFRCKGHITSKDVERAENRILRQLYQQVYQADQEEETNQANIPGRVLCYYQEFMKDFTIHLNERQRKLLEKHGVLPFHIYLLVQKIAILKRILPKVALDYFNIYIEPKDRENINMVIDTFYENRSAVVGELMTQGIVILEEYYQKTACVPEQAPTKFFTRLRKYRLEFGPQYKELIEKLTEILEESVEDSAIVTEIKGQIHNLTDFTTSALQIDQIMQDEHQFEQELGISEKEFNDQKKKILISYRLVQKELEIPKVEFESIINYMLCHNLQYKKRKKKLIKGYHTYLIVMIIALWQLLHYGRGYYLSENSIEKLNKSLGEIFRIYKGPKGIITTKSIELAELDLLYTKNMRNGFNKTVSGEMIYS